MEKNRRLLGSMFTLLIIASLAIGCAKNSYLHVNYRFSEPSKVLDIKQVCIDFKDLRSDQTFLGKDAQQRFKHFNGRFQLFIDRNNNTEFTGIYDLNTLFKETLNLRLKSQGFEVLKIKSDICIVMEIELKRFTLDLKGKTWTTSIAYTSRLLYGKGAYVGEDISATAERQKIWGKKDAEKTLSEAITDAVNKLDIQGLFEKIGR